MRGGGNAPTPNEYDALNDSDSEIVDVLSILFDEGGKLRGEMISKNDTSPPERKTPTKIKKLGKGDIRHYFQTKKQSPCKDGNKYLEWCEKRVETLKNQTNKASFNESIRNRVKATSVWGRSSDYRRKLLVNHGEKTTTNIPIQDMSQKPVLIGGDAVALYPSMDMVETTEMVARTALETSVRFRNIDFKFLLVYLFLILGADVLSESGLGEFIPKRKKWKDSKACSLAAQLNRDIDNWHVKVDNLSWQEEKLLIALLLKVAILAVMDSTCYSFGGRLFKQVSGAGIGLRASACMAKLLMGLIDRFWAGIQGSWDIKMYLYFRYIDDLRLFLHPINPGWKWGSDGWMFSNPEMDTRSPTERTKEEIKKSLNAVTNFIQFTTEGEEDFNGFLPTLDFQTQVQSSGKILYKFFSKPMSNNITIQHGTGKEYYIQCAASRTHQTHGELQH